MERPVGGRRTERKEVDRNSALQRLSLLLRLVSAAFVATAAGVHLIDYEFFDPLPGKVALGSTSELPVVQPTQAEAERARDRLGLSRSSERVESFAVFPPNADDYQRVPAASIRVYFCAHLPSDEECRRRDPAAIPFRLDHLIHHDRGGGVDAWDFIFVPDRPVLGRLRFLYRSNGGASGHHPDDFGFVLGDPGEEVGSEIAGRIAWVAGFGDSALADSLLDKAASRNAKGWWGELPGGFQRFQSSFADRASAPISSKALEEVWSAARKTAAWFAVVAIVVGLIASLVGLTGAGAGLLDWASGIPGGVATLAGLFLGLIASGGYFLAVEGEARGIARDEADASIVKVLAGSIDGADSRAAQNELEIKGLPLLKARFPGVMIMSVQRAAPPTVRGEFNEGLTVSGPLWVRARAAGGRGWNAEMRSSVAVRIYEGPSAVPQGIELEGVRVFPAVPVGRRSADNVRALR